MLLPQIRRKGRKQRIPQNLKTMMVIVISARRMQMVSLRSREGAGVVRLLAGAGVRPPRKFLLKGKKVLDVDVAVDALGLLRRKARSLAVVEGEGKLGRGAEPSSK